MSKAERTEVKCPSCLSEDTQYAFKKYSYLLYECSECGLLFVHPMPRATQEIYNKEYFTGGKEGHGYVDYENDNESIKVIFQKYLRDIQAACGSKGRLLDVGAATGLFVEQARNAGYIAEGIELSDYAAHEAQRLGRPVRQGTLESLIDQNISYRIITMLDFFEHIPDPRKEMATASSILESGGYLIMNLPDRGSILARLLGRNWHLVVPPEHLLYFNRVALTRLAEEFGMKCVLKRRHVKTFSLPYALTTLSRHVPLGLVRRLAEFSQHSFLKNIRFPIPTMDNMFIVFQKGNA